MKYTSAEILLAIHILTNVYNIDITKMNRSFYPLSENKSVLNSIFKLGNSRCGSQPCKECIYSIYQRFQESDLRSVCSDETSSGYNNGFNKNKRIELYNHYNIMLDIIDGL